MGHIVTHKSRAPGPSGLGRALDTVVSACCSSRSQPDEESRRGRRCHRSRSPGRARSPCGRPALGAMGRRGADVAPRCEEMWGSASQAPRRAGSAPRLAQGRLSMARPGGRFLHHLPGGRFRAGPGGSQRPARAAVDLVNTIWPDPSTLAWHSIPAAHPVPNDLRQPPGADAIDLQQVGGGVQRAHGHHRPGACGAEVGQGLQLLQRCGVEVDAGR